MHSPPREGGIVGHMSPYLCRHRHRCTVGDISRVFIRQTTANELFKVREESRISCIGLRMGREDEGVIEGKSARGFDGHRLI